MSKSVEAAFFINDTCRGPRSGNSIAVTTPVTAVAFSCPSLRQQQRRAAISSLRNRCPDDDEEDDVVQRLGLDGQFERWSFLQRLLDGDYAEKTDDVHRVLYRSLALTDLEQLDTSGARGESRHPLDGNPAGVGTLRALLAREDGTLPVLDDDASVRAELASLLPDVEEDEDAHQGIWDVVEQLHGKESVARKLALQELEHDDAWHRQCLAARLLIHFNFLSVGIIASK